MPAAGTPPEELGFLTIGLFDEADPAAGHETTLRMIELGVIPTDSASPSQRSRYEEYVAARTPRTASPQGPGRLLFARDLLGPSAQIAAELHAHAGFQEVTEVAFALPFTFDEPDYVQILTDIATRLGPALGWTPSP